MRFQPLPVWPYAKMVQLKPFITSTDKGRAVWSYTSSYTIDHRRYHAVQRERRWSNWQKRKAKKVKKKEVMEPNNATWRWRKQMQLNGQNEFEG